MKERTVHLKDEEILTLTINGLVVMQVLLNPDSEDEVLVDMRDNGGKIDFNWGSKAHLLIRASIDGVGP